MFFVVIHLIEIFFDSRVQFILYENTNLSNFCKIFFCQSRRCFWGFPEKITDRANTSFLSAIVLFKQNWVREGTCYLVGLIFQPPEINPLLIDPSGHLPPGKMNLEIMELFSHLKTWWYQSPSILTHWLKKEKGREG